MPSEPTETEKDLLSARIRTLVREKQFSFAIEWCQNLLQEWPKREHHYIFGRIAYIYDQMGDSTAALDALNEAVSLEPASPAHLDHRMILAIGSKNYELARHDATKLMEVEKQRGSKAFVESAHVYRAYASIQLKDYLEAIRDLSLVSDQGPFRIDGKLWSKSELINLANAD
jgi:tetratricopeptide (TPR) repeat protein